MNTYKEGYQAGWTSYFEYCVVKSKKYSKNFIAEAKKLAEKAELALSSQQQKDYWLGYYHGRSAAKTRTVE